MQSRRVYRQGSSVVLSFRGPDRLSVCNVVVGKQGAWFRVPEVWGATGHFRAAMSMRPQAIWPMEFIR